MIGFYDYTVILTYISLASSILGMISACYTRIGWAIFFLGMSGLLDTFDGKVARTKKNRTEDQKRFGIQIDSLCDIVCFGVCPVIICWFSGIILSTLVHQHKQSFEFELNTVSDRFKELCDKEK